MSVFSQPELSYSYSEFCLNFLIVLVAWLVILPVAKLVLVNYISGTEGAKISYQDTYPSYVGKFISAYSYNSTHYRIMEVSCWSGIEERLYQKINVTGAVPDASAYVERAGKLYSLSLTV